MQHDPNESAVTYYPLGDAAVVAEFGQEISVQINQRIRRLSRQLDRVQMQTRGFIEYVPAFASVTVYYDPCLLTYEAVVKMLERAVGESDDDPVDADIAPTKTIPVLYGGEAGPDLAAVAAHTGLTAEQVIELHTAAEYLVYMIGFAPGFPYLGGMDPQLATPRRAQPRKKIPAGSVGIAGSQTGVYPLATPGGWQLIGRTPLVLFDSQRTEPALLKAGDRVRFKRISTAEYEKLKSSNDGH